MEDRTVLFFPKREEGNKELKEDLDGGVDSISLVVKPLDGIPSEEGIDINCLSDVESLMGLI